MSPSKRIAGDPDHEFITITLPEMITANKAIRAVVSRLRYRDSVDIETRKSLRAQYPMIPPDAYAEDTRVLNKGVEERIVSGQFAPSEAELMHLALDYGLDGERKKQFVSAGEDYIRHCTERGAKRQTEKTVAATTAEAPAVMATGPETLQDVLKDIMSRRRFQGGKVLKENELLNGPSKIMSPGVLVVQMGINSSFNKRLLNGSHPHSTAGEESNQRHRYALEELLSLIRADTDDQIRAFAAFDQQAQQGVSTPHAAQAANRKKNRVAEK